MEKSLIKIDSKEESPDDIISELLSYPGGKLRVDVAVFLRKIMKSSGRQGWMTCTHNKQKRGR